MINREFPCRIIVLRAFHLGLIALSFASGYFLFKTRMSDAVGKVLPLGGVRATKVIPSVDTRSTGAKWEDLLKLSQKPGSPAQRAELYAAIQGMTVQDFLALGTDFAALDEKMRKLPEGLQKMVVEATLDRWVEVDPNSALAWIKGAQVFGEITFKPNQTLKAGVGSFDGMISVLARRRPEWLLELSLTSSPKVGRDVGIRMALAQLAEQDPGKARKLLNGIKDPKLLDIGRLGFVCGLAKSDPLAAIEETRLLPDEENSSASKNQAIGVIAGEAGRQGVGMLRQCFDALKEQNNLAYFMCQGLAALAETRPSAARTLISELISKKELRNELDDGYLGSVFGVTDPAATAEWFTKLSPEDQIPLCKDFLKQLMYPWSKNNPKESLTWFASLPNETLEKSQLIRGLMNYCLSWNYPEAREWFESLPPGEIRNQAELGYTFNLLRRGDVQAAKRRYINATVADEGDALAEQFASELVREDPAKSLDWAMALPEGRARSRVLEVISKDWIAKDPAVATAWVQSLGLGSDRDAAAKALVEQSALNDVPAALSWLNQISDVTTRSQAAQSLFFLWDSIDPQSARHWLRDLHGVDGTWKKTFIRRTQ